MSTFETIKNIAYLEPINSFSEIAKDEFCAKHNITCFSTPIKTIKQIVEYVESNPILDNIRENNGDFVLAKNRNEIFYEILKLSEKEIALVEDKWTFPRYKMKSKKLLLEV